MARVLKLKKGSTELNLAAAAGSGLRGQKWVPRSPDIEYDKIPPYLIEEMDIRVDRTSHDDLATSMQSLDQMRRWAAMYRSMETIYEPVWLHAKMDGESGERRACIRSIESDWRSNQIAEIGPAAAHDALMRLVMERHPYWEALTATTGTSLTVENDDAALSHSYGTPGGDVGARIEELQIQRPNDAWPVGLDRLWIGLRTVGTPANFVPVWEIENALSQVGTDLSAATGDAGCSPNGAGYKRTVSFATETGWANRWGVALGNVTSDETDNLGRFLWLLRYKVDSGTECEVHLRWRSWYDAPDGSSIDGPTKTADNTSWDFLEMGDGQLPPHSMKVDITSSWEYWVRLSNVEIWARRTAGSGSLHLDCLCLIPIDEGYLIAKDIGNTGSLYTFRYYMTADDKGLTLLMDQYNEPINWPMWSESNFYLPPTLGHIILAHAQTSASDIDDTVTIPKIKWFPRWANLRGAE